MSVASPGRGAPSMLRAEVWAHPARFSRVLPLTFRHVPLLYAVVALGPGLAMSHHWRPAALLAAATAALLLLSAVALWRAARVAPCALFAAGFLLGWLLGVLSPRPLPDTALLPYTDGLRRTVDATVIALRPLPVRIAEGKEDPVHPGEQATDRDTAAEDARLSADLRIERVEQLDPDASTMTAAHGTARIVLRAEDAAQLQCGSRVQATLRLYRPREFRDPGVWQYGAWLAAQDVSATGMAVPGHVHADGAVRPPIACRMQQARAWAAGRLQRFVQWQRGVPLPQSMRWSGEDSAAWSAMLFGDHGALTHSLRASFERTGTFHLFVVSGMHVALIAGAAVWLARRLGLGRVAGSLAAGAAVTLYALLTGFGPPVQRALLMTLAFLFAEALARERTSLNAVGAALLTMLVLQPQALWDSSFQMTALIATTIAGIAVPLLERTLAPYARACRRLPLLRLDRRMPPRVAQFRVLLRWIVGAVEQRFGRASAVVLLGAVRCSMWLAAATVVALVTELTMALPMAFYFHRFTWLALPANLLVVPLLAPLMICGIASFLLCLVAYPLALAASVPAALLLHATGFVVRTLATVGGDVRTPGPYPAATVCLALLVGMSVALLRASRRSLAWLGVACAVLVALGTVALRKRMLAPHALLVSAIDVGQGDSILLTAPNGQSLLIDAGGIAGAEQDLRRETFDIGEEVVSPYLWSRGLQRLDVLALSHAHMDHLGGMRAVLRNFRPRELWLSVDVPSPLLHLLLQDAKSQGTVVRFLRAGSHRQWQSIALDVLGPEPAYEPSDAASNDDSLVLRASYGRASALLAGDAEEPSEEAMLSHSRLVPVTLLKVGHHGSLTSSSEAFLDALAPRVAVISCGRGNHFGHPRMPVLQRLQQRHTATARTDTMGAVEYALHEDGTVSVAFPAGTP